MSAIKRLQKLKAEAKARAPRTSVAVPLGFLAFCAWLGVVLTAGQAELARVAFDGAEPVDRDLAAALFGGSDLSVGTRRSVVAAVCGARAGKSYVLVALRLVHGMLVRDVSALPPGQRAVALIIAPRDDLRMEVFRYALGAVMNKPELAAMLAGPPRVDEFTLRRPDGALVSFETGVATMGGTAARGRWFTDFALDECAFFRDASYKVNDDEIYKAGSARVLPGGQTIIASTPWAEAGLLHTLWKKRPPDVIVAHAPTLVLNDTPYTRDIVARAEVLDADNAAREYGAKFMTTGTTVFFEGAAIDMALSEEPFVPEPKDEIAAGADFGFRSDSSGLILVALRGGNVHVYEGKEERPQEGVPLKPSVTVASFAKTIDGKCTYVMADGHYREAIAEHLETHGLVFAPAPLTPADTHVRARMLLREGRLIIHPLPFRERLVQQMREVQGKPTSGGGMSIIYPKWAKGGHGDLVAALVLAAWQVTGDAVATPEPEEGTKAWEVRKREERQQAMREQQERAAWMPKNAPKRRYA